MKLTIAFDDVSLPLPKMRRPDIRQRVIEAVLDLAADAGVDDVHLIAALALHRRMTEAELRHAVGDRVYDAFAPRGHALPARRRGPRQPRRTSARRRRARRSRSTSGPPTSRPARLRQHQPRRDGRRLEVDRHRPRLVPLACATTTTRRRWRPATASWTSTTASCTRATGGWARCCVDSGVKVFQIETTLNTDTFPSPFDFLSKREWEWNAKDRATYLGDGQVAVAGADPAGPQDLPRRSRRRTR